MGDIYVNEQISFRIANHGLPNVEHRLVFKDPTGQEIVTAPLSDVHLGILGTQATGAYFARTGRPVWPVLDHGGPAGLEEAALVYEGKPLEEVLGHTQTLGEIVADVGAEQMGLKPRNCDCGRTENGLGMAFPCDGSCEKANDEDPHVMSALNDEGGAPFVPADGGGYDPTTQALDEPFRHVDPPAPRRRRVV